MMVFADNLGPGGESMRTTALVIALSVLTSAQDNPKELGRVTWLRSLEDGLKQARKVEKPVFLQFQEVPG